MKSLKNLGIKEVMDVLPHRHPFLLIDGLTILEDGKSAVGFKNVTFNEPFFEGHFPGNPVMPGVLIIEAIAQTSVAMWAFLNREEAKGKAPYFTTIERARFRKPVLPGDCLELHVKLVRSFPRQGIYHYEGKGLVRGEVAAEMRYGAAAVDVERRLSDG